MTKVEEVNYLKEVERLASKGAAKASNSLFANTGVVSAFDQPTSLLSQVTNAAKSSASASSASASASSSSSKVNENVESNPFLM